MTKFTHNNDFFGEFIFECSSLLDFKREVEGIAMSHDNIKMPDAIVIQGKEIVAFYDGHKETIGIIVHEVVSS